jgi:flagellar basal-body rod modification protein FlgD
MSTSMDSMFDITNRYVDFSKNATDDTSGVRTLEQLKAAQKAKEEASQSHSTLTFEDMLLLMVTQLQNQTIDNQADPNDMMNQIIQMTVMQALTEVSTQVDQLTEANILNYSASLVGKEVTVGVWNEETESIDEVFGTVTATGTYKGQQVLFIGDKYYPLSSIMAVGKLPEKKPDEVDPDKKPDEVDPDKKPDEVDPDKKPDEVDPDKKPDEVKPGEDNPNKPDIADGTENGGTEAAGDENGTKGI